MPDNNKGTKGQKTAQPVVGRRDRVVVPLFLGILLTTASCLKPLHIDDAYFYLFAQQVARKPMEPYRFSMMFFDRPVRAGFSQGVVAPPVLNYWWGTAIRIVGDNPVLWKACLLPFCLAFTFAVHGLLRQFAPGWEGLFTTFLVLSPTFLPSLNLMLDIPAQALGLLGLLVMVRACDSNRAGRALLAGVLVGVAIQTKYTGFVFPLVLLLYSWTRARLKLGVAAAATAALVALAWEAFLLLEEGRSHLFFHLLVAPFPRDGIGEIGVGLLTTLGATAPFVVALALIALRWPLWIASVALALILAAEGIMVTASASPSRIVGASMGAAILAALGAAAWKTWHLSAKEQGEDPDRSRSGSPARFLALWLVVELAGYFALTPFPAVRRTMGLMVAGSMLIAHLISRSPLRSPARRLALAAVVGQVLLGIGFALIDQLDAESDRAAAEKAVAAIRKVNPHARIWYAGYWGFQFYAERSGMRQVVPAAYVPPQGNRPPRIQDWGEEAGVAHLKPTLFRQGDYVVIPRGIVRQDFSLPSRKLALQEIVRINPDLPFTARGLYAGDYPLHLLKGPRVEALIYRVQQECLPLIQISPR